MKILLVDDAPIVIAVMTALLNRFGHEVFAANNGKVAVDLFKKLAPDLVLMDIEMPIMNGFEAASRIRASEMTQQWAWTPIIFLTASDTVDNLITAIEAGGDDFMAKSVPAPVLQAKMKAMGRIATLRQRLSIANEKLEELANIDGLTGLCNRRNMDIRADIVWDACIRNGNPFALLMLDIDNFKKYNDHYGHQAGDDALCKVSDAIAAVIDLANSTALTHGAFPARYGGEEFAVIIPSASRASYEVVASQIVCAVGALSIPHEKNNECNIVTISIGGCRVESANDELSVMFRKADENLYLAKENGRNRAEID